MAKLDIQIQIEKTIKPSTPTPDHLRTLKLSVYDQVPQRLYLAMLLYYLPSTEQNSKEVLTERCDRLQKSLADTLAANFYPIAGRFKEEGFSIDCNDEGAVYVEAKVDAVLAEFLHDGPKLELLDDHLPWGVNPPDTSLPTSPLLAVQVNIFNCGGLVIGIQLSHFLGDCYSVATFLKEWARAARTGTTQGCLSSYGHLSALYPPKPLPDLTPPPLEGLVTRRFVFDASAIAKLKDIIGSIGIPYANAVAVRSLIWKVLVSIDTAKHGHPRTAVLSCPVYLRSKSNLPTLQHALGTFALAATAILWANQPRKELSVFAKSIASAMGDPSISIGYESMNALYNWLSTPSDGSVAELDVYVCLNWGGFPLYEADFGWGKPIWVSSSVRQYAMEFITLFDTRDGNGIEAWVNLKEEVMAEFEKDPDILTFSPYEKRQLIPKLG